MKPAASTASAKADRALQIARTLENAREVKFLVSQFSAQIPRTGYLANLNDVQQGVSDSQRVGDRIRTHSMKLKLWRVIPGSATGRFSVRVLIIHDRQNSITNGNEVLLNPDSAYSPLLPFVKDYRLRFTVLYDSGANHMDQYNKGDTIEWHAKILTKVQFLQGTDEPVTGSIKLLAFSNQASTGTQPLLIGTVRYNFTDA